MEFEGKIMVKTIETGGGTTMTIAETTIIVMIETTIGGEEWRGLTMTTG